MASSESQAYYCFLLDGIQVESGLGAKEEESPATAHFIGLAFFFLVVSRNYVRHKRQVKNQSGLIAEAKHMSE